MDKKNIAKFLKNKNRGVYTLIVDMYAETIMKANMKMALELIKEDLEKETGEQIALNYFSLAHAIKKFKKGKPKLDNPEKKKWEFKDDHEYKSSEHQPGGFKIEP